MPRHPVIIVECDLCNTEIEDAGPPETLMRNKRAIEYDLCERCKAKVDKVLDPLFEAGHRPGQELVLPSAKPRRAPQRAEEPLPCRKGCGVWSLSGSGRGAHERVCDGTPPQYPCDVAGCHAGFKVEENLRKHKASGEHVIPTRQQLRAAEAALAAA